jgi:hypothetical protein
MTFQTKYNDNNRLLRGYVAYLDECTGFDEKLRLSSEIGKLKAENDQISKMEFSITQEEVINYSINVNAVL